MTNRIRASKKPASDAAAPAAPTTPAEARARLAEIDREIAANKGIHTPYPVDSDTKLRRAFPKGVAPPALLFDFAAWLRGKPWGSVGCFDLSAGTVEHLLPPQADAADDFAMVFRMPDGGVAGLWFDATRDADRAPLVHMDSEGGIRTLAANFALFLHRLAAARFGTDGPPSDFRPQAFIGDSPQRVPRLTQALELWLSLNAQATQALAEATPAQLRFVDDRRAKAWLDRVLADVERQKKGDPLLAALAEAAARLKLGLRRSTSAWDYESYRAFAAGATMIVRRGTLLVPMPRIDHYLKRLPVAVEEALRGPLIALREAHAKRRKGEGLWPSATMTVMSDGTVDIAPTYDHEFAIGFDAFTPQDFAADQARYPRRENKLAPWHKAMLAQARTA